MERTPRPRPRAPLLSAVLALAAAAFAACAPGRPPEPGARTEPGTPGRWYWAYVANEDSDVVSRIRFGPEGGGYEKSVRVGVMPRATDAPSGLAVSGDGRHWYVTTAPGAPTGHLFKYETGSDRLVGSVRLGSAPSAVALSPDGREAWIVDPGAGPAGRAAALAVVATDSLREASRLAACTAPRASRVAPSGGRAYVLCGEEDLLVEVDARGRRVRRAVRLGPDRGRVVAADRLPRSGGGSSPGDGAPPDPSSGCRPSGLAAGAGRVWVACAGSDEVLEVNAGSLEIRRVLSAGPGPSSLAVTQGERVLLAANREGGSLSVIHLGEGREVARLATSRPAPGGVDVTDDGRYAFVANASEGARRSTVDVFDLVALTRVAEVEVEHGAGAVAFWRSAPARRR